MILLRCEYKYASPRDGIRKVKWVLPGCIWPFPLIISYSAYDESILKSWKLIKYYMRAAAG
jgi:hypothetical protein